jgi:hydrophobic/amphiphilic exporter-1 (mainly G- bacteria), HAE1 family
MPLTDTAVKRPVATMMVFLIIITLGIAGLRHLPIDLLPPIEFPQLTVAINYPNVGPEEIEKVITRPVENAIAGVPGVERVRSRSSLGESRVTLDFARGTKLDEAANDLRAALDPIRSWLPREAQQPRIWKFDPNDVPIVVVGASSPTLDLQQLTLVLHREITRRFEQVPGVGTIGVWGGVYRQVHINLLRDRLSASQLSSDDVRAALAAGNVNVSGGNVGTGVQQLYVRTLGEFGDLNEIANTVVSVSGGAPVRVRDVAEVGFGYRDLERVVQIDGRPMVRFVVNKQTGANTVAVAAAIREEVERINQERSDVLLFVASDQSTFIQGSIDNVRQSASWGALLAVLVLYLFLRNGRSTFIIAAAIPISIIATFGLLYFNGLTLNQMSFGGLALGVGLVVDNAVVVLENITRLRDEGRSARDSALVGTKEVSGAIIASTLTTSVIFLPVVFMQSISGVVFRQLALVVVFALICSLFVALTLVPMLASKMLDRRARPHRAPKRERLGWARRIFGRIETGYLHVLEGAMHRKKIVFIVVGVLVAGAVATSPLIPVELAPQTDADEIDIDLMMADGTNVAVVARYLEELEAVVRAHLPPGSVRHLGTEVRDGRGEIELTMEPDSPISTSALAERLRLVTDGLIPGGNLRIRAQTGLWVLRVIFGSGGNEDVTIQLRGHDLAHAEQAGRQLQLAIEELPGITGVRVGRREGRPEENLVLDRAKLAELGLSVREVAEVVQTAIGGSRAGEFRLRGDEFPIMVRLRPEDRRTAQNLANIPIRLPSGDVIPLSAVIDRQAGRGPPQIDRVDSQRVTYITANLARGTQLGEAVQAIRARASRVVLPPGFSLYFGGEYEEQQKAAADFRLSILIALLLIYMVMAGQFERFLDPLIVLFSVPLAIIGVVPTLLLTGTTINMQSLMGLIMLTGIVVNNAIVLVDYINLLRRDEGLDLPEAVRRAGRRRLRPILMTTLTTVLGLLPLSFGIGTGAEIQASLARVVLGGLLASTLATLVFIPVLYLGSHQLLARWRRRATSETPAAYPQPERL